MYDVLVYRMLWDRKKILNISLWRIIRLNMRPATGLCPHISLHNISLERVYCSWYSPLKITEDGKARNGDVSSNVDQESQLISGP